MSDKGRAVTHGAAPGVAATPRLGQRGQSGGLSPSLCLDTPSDRGTRRLPSPALQPARWVPCPATTDRPCLPRVIGRSKQEEAGERASSRAAVPDTEDAHHSRLVPDGLQAVLHGPAVRRRLHILTPHGRASGTFPQAQDGAGESCKQNRREHVAPSHKARLPRSPSTGPRHPVGTLGRRHQLSRRASHSQGAAWSPASRDGEGRPIWFTVFLCHYF